MRSLVPTLLGALALLAAVLPARAEDRRDWARTVSAHIVPVGSDERPTSRRASTA